MKWNKVTRYSRWGAIILFLVILPILSFHIGSVYKEVVLMNEKVAVLNTSDRLKEKDTVLDPCAHLEKQQSMNQCAYDEFKKIDARLQKVYAQVAESEQFKSDLGVKIANVHKVWIEYRKSECDAEGGIYEGGSLKPFIVSDCMITLTKERIGVLEALLKLFSI